MWSVTFIGARGKALAVEVHTDDHLLVDELTERGITRATARRLVELLAASPVLC